MTNRLGPHDCLAIGSRVQLDGGFRGVVTKAECAHTGVFVHTVKVTEKYHRLCGNQYTWIPHSKTWRGNYRFVMVLA